ncbi:MAG: PP2C family serine/threonine-protein phosphatase [Negativicutes bacterium]
MTDVAASLQQVIPGNAQHIGARSEQQDSFGFSAFDDTGFVQHAGVLAVVADGMGGLALGKDSSATAVRTFLATYAVKEPEEKIGDVLDRALHAANRAVNRRAAEAGVEGEAGTTLVAAVIHEGRLFRISAGDSRIYLFREGRLRQITTDYNYGRILDKMVEKGEMSSSEASSHPSRAALTSYLGKASVDDYDHPSDLSLELVSGDKILLASDGLFGFLQEEDIVRLVEAEPQPAAEALVHATVAKQSPYQDNVTVAILGYDLPPAKPLAETQIRRDETVAKTASKTESSQSQQSGSSSGKGKWLKIAVVILALAVAGFIGGRYFGEQAMAPDLPVEKTEKETHGTPKALQEKQGDKSGSR